MSRPPLPQPGQELEDVRLFRIVSCSELTSYKESCPDLAISKETLKKQDVLTVRWLCVDCALTAC